MNRAVIALKMDRERRALLIGPQSGPGVGHQVGRRRSWIDPEQGRVLGQFAIDRLASPSGSRREEPAHRAQDDADLLLCLADRGRKDILPGLDVPARRTQKNSSIGRRSRPGRNYGLTVLITRQVRPFQTLARVRMPGLPMARQ
jgi:hypothetical protein